MQRLIEFINSEDKKNPYTDQELAEFLSIPRLKVIQKRNELNIPDSRDRRKELLLADLREILKKKYKFIGTKSNRTNDGERL